MENVLNTLFPPECFYCNKNYGYFCKSCLQKCKLARSYYCVVCDKPSVKGKTHYNCLIKTSPLSIFSAYEYKGSVRKCIMSSKYRSKTFAPLKTLSKEASYIASKCDISYKGYITVSIPLSKGRARERGFNQADLIAAAITREFSLRFDDSILIRDKETKAQHAKTREERFKNVKNAFKISKNLFGLKVLVVDDICTTGATLLEASRVLYEGGAKEVRCFTLAKEF